MVCATDSPLVGVAPDVRLFFFTNAVSFAYQRLGDWFPADGVIRVTGARTLPADPPSREHPLMPPVVRAPVLAPPSPSVAAYLGVDSCEDVRPMSVGWDRLPL